MSRRVALAVVALLLVIAVVMWRTGRLPSVVGPPRPPTAPIAASSSAATNAAPDAAHPVPTIAAPVTPDEVAAKLAQLDGRLKPEDYEVDALAAKLQTIDAAFAFVRDRIGFESYDGLLRGGKGTLLARAGNAVDRAMLLAAVLQRNKVPVRIATGQLPEADAERLFARIFEPPATPGAGPRSALTQRIFTRAERDYRTMQSALGGAPPAVSGPSHADVIREIQRHAWVQAQRDGQWIDLDPSFGDSTVGHAYAPVERTFDGPPQPLMQQVTIRIVSETLSNGTLNRDVALESTLPAYQLIDRQIYLIHHPPPPPMNDTRAAPLQGIFGNPDEWQPMLLIPGSTTDGTTIDFGAGASAAGSVRNPGQAVLDAFGTAPSSGHGPAFVAEWLEFEVKLPGGGSDVTRRALVDRGGTAWRRSGTLDPSRLRDLPRNGKLLTAPQAIYNIWFSGGKHDLLAFDGAAEALLEGTIPGTAQDAEPTIIGAAWPLAMRDLSWLVESDHLLVPAVNDLPGLRLYADSPRIFVWDIGAPGANGEMTIESDLRRDRLRAIARDAASQAAIAQHKLWFGALEGALEHEMGAPSPENAGEAFVTTSSLADGGDAARLGPGAAAPTAGDPETAARLQAAVAAGDTVLVPKRVLAGGTSGWWQIAHDTGDVRAVLDNLGGGSGTKLPGGARKGPNHIKLPGNRPPPDPQYLPQSREYYLPKGPKAGEFAEEESNLQIALRSMKSFAFVTWAILDAVALVVLILEVVGVL